MDLLCGRSLVKRVCAASPLFQSHGNWIGTKVGGFSFLSIVREELWTGRLTIRVLLDPTLPE